MTKSIRVENADNSPFKVAVEVWDKGWPLGEAPDTKARTILLEYPTAMTPSDLYITDTRYLVVRETVPADHIETKHYTDGTSATGVAPPRFRINRPRSKPLRIRRTPRPSARSPHQVGS